MKKYSLLIKMEFPEFHVPNSTGYVRKFLMQHAAEINRSGKITFLDFHRDSPDTPIHLSVVVPILDELTNRSFGFVVFFINPEDLSLSFNKPLAYTEPLCRNITYSAVTETMFCF